MKRQYGRGVHLLEHPRDPGETPFSSVFATTVFEDSKIRMKAKRVLGDQCCFGAPVLKSSEYSGTVDYLGSLTLLCSGKSSHHIQSSFGHRWLEDESFQSRRLSRYPTNLSKAIAIIFEVLSKNGNFR